MPTHSDLPKGARTLIRVLSVLLYMLLAWQSWRVIFSNHDVIHEALGNLGANLFGLSVALTALICAISQAFHRWLIERAALVWLMIGALVYAVAFRELMLFSILCALGIRLVQLEMFAHKQPSRRGLRFRRKVFQQ